MVKQLLTIAVLVVAISLIGYNIWKQNKMVEDKLSEINDNLVATEEALNNGAGKDINVSDKINFDVDSLVKEGQRAPDFELTTLDGRSVKLSDYQGKKVILNFWATWCPPCKAEMPHIQNFYENYEDSGVEVVAVNITNQDKGREKIVEFVEEFGLTFSIPLDEEGSIGLLYEAFAIPTSYVIDSNGYISKKVVGPMDEEMMINLINNAN